MVKCDIPSFVSDFVSVVSWVDNDNVEYFPSQQGTMFKKNFFLVHTSKNASKILILKNHVSMCHQFIQSSDGSGIPEISTFWVLKMPGSDGFFKGKSNKAFLHFSPNFWWYIR